MKVDDIEFLPLKDFFYLRGQPWGDSKPSNRTTGGNGAGSADGNEPVAKARNSLRGRGNDSDLVTHPGKLLFQTGNMNADAARIGEIIR